MLKIVFALVSLITAEQTEEELKYLEKIDPGMMERDLRTTYKVRVHKNFIKEVMDKNLRMFLNHIENLVNDTMLDIGDGFSLVDTDIRLGTPNAKSTKVDEESDTVDLTKSIESDLFFDRGEIVMEIEGLMLKGSATLLENSQELARVSIESPLDLAQIVLFPTHVEGGNVTANDGDYLGEKGFMYPKLNVEDVALQMNPEQTNIKINTQSSLSVNQELNIIKLIKKWIKLQLAQRENHLKFALQKAERQIMSDFGYHQNLTYGVQAKTTLDDAMQVEADYLFVQFRTHFEGEDLADNEQRRLRSKFIDEVNFLRDVQQILSENYFNYYFFTMFYREKPFSLMETLFGMIPDDITQSGQFLGMIFNSNFFKIFFNGMPANKKLDLRCSFSKDYLMNAKLGESKLSRLRFREGDIIDFELHFGCGIYLFDFDQNDRVDEPDILSLQALTDMITMLSVDTSDHTKWTSFRSFFVSSEIRTELDLSPEAKIFQPFGLHGINMASELPFFFGKIKTITPKINELIVYDGNQKSVDEAAKLNQALLNLSDLHNQLDGVPKMIVSWVRNISIPIMPFPMLQRCLGLNSRDSVMRIKEGHIVLAFDFKVEASHIDCLFNLKESTVNKSLRWISKEAGKLTKFQKIGKFFEVADLHIKEHLKNMPKLPDMSSIEFQDLKDLDGLLGFKAQNFFENSVKKVAENGQEILKNFELDKLKESAKETIEKVMNFELKPLFQN